MKYIRRISYPLPQYGLEKDGLISKKRGLDVSLRDDVKVTILNPVAAGEVYKSRIQRFDIQTLSEGWITATNRIRNRWDVSGEVSGILYPTGSLF